MRRLIKFAGIFLGAALLIILLVFGLNREAIILVYENRQALAEGSEWVEQTYSMRGLTDYIAEHPEMVSIHSLNPDDPADTLSWSADRQRPMGMTSGFFLLTAYASAIEQGDLDPARRIEWEEVDRYGLPRIGRSAHQQTLRQARNLQLLDDSRRLRLEDALKLLIRYQSPALFDYLLLQLDDGYWERLQEELQLTSTDRPLPFSGLLLTLSPTIQQVDAETVQDHWSGERRELFEEETLANTRSYLLGEDRQAWRDAIDRNRIGLNFTEQRELLRLLPMSTPRELTRLLKLMIDGELISGEVSRRVSGWLDMPLEEGPLGQYFTQYGALYESRIGLFGGIDYGTASDGTTRIQAVFFDRIHLAVWFHISSNHMHQDFQQRLIRDPELYQTMKQATLNRVR